jgi:hypothetical protein
MAEHAPQVAKEWQQFLVCLLLHMMLPLSPLLIEQIIQGYVSPTTFYVAITIYALAIGTSSRNVLLFIICVIIGVSSAAVFGIAVGRGYNSVSYMWGHMALLGVFAIHALERYNRHVVEAEPFLEFE